MPDRGSEDAWSGRSSRCTPRGRPLPRPAVCVGGPAPAPQEPRRVSWRGVSRLMELSTAAAIAFPGSSTTDFALRMKCAQEEAGAAPINSAWSPELVSRVSVGGFGAAFHGEAGNCPGNNHRNLNIQ